jgi:hypothetical protein
MMQDYMPLEKLAHHRVLDHRSCLFCTKRTRHASTHLVLSEIGPTLGGMNISAFLIVASSLLPYIIAIPLNGMIFAATYVATWPSETVTVSNHNVRGAATQ